MCKICKGHVTLKLTMKHRERDLQCIIMRKIFREELYILLCLLTCSFYFSSYLKMFHLHTNIGYRSTFSSFYDLRVSGGSHGG